MKTKKFEEILRRKLESLKPDFQEQDWDKFQAFQQHAAPSFWQTYGHWLGYAVAVLTTATVAVLYYNQSRQNDALLREMKELREQIVTGTQASADRLGAGIDSVEAGLISRRPYTGAEPAMAHSDTIYIVEPRVIYRDRPVFENSNAPRSQTESPGSTALAISENQSEQKVGKSEKQITTDETNRVRENATQDLSPALNESTFRSGKENTVTNIENSTPQPESAKLQSGKALPNDVASNKVPVPIETPPQVRLPHDRLAFENIQSLPAPSLPEPGKTEYRHLMNRMPGSTRKRDIQIVAKSDKVVESKNTPAKPAATENTEKITKEESLLPKFGLNLPFRVGAGQQWEGHTRAFSLWNEVLFGEHWSAQTGISWQKLEDQKFFDVKIFDQKMRSDFRKYHADKLPPSFDIFNISASTKVIGIPLNLTYRNEIGRNFTYFVGAGTNVNLIARQTLSFDFKRPSRDYGQESKERNIPFPVFNNVNALLGVEKRWSPIVLQLSTLLNTRFKTFPFLDDRVDVGLQVKVLYEFKAAKKK